jgi:hypothetical protein
MNFTNYFEHPADNRYMVYKYQIAQHAQKFEARLVEAGIPFEKHLENEEGVDWTYYGVHKDYRKEANRANHLTVGEHREMFIPNKRFRWGVVIFGLVVITLAILSAIMNQL